MKFTLTQAAKEVGRSKSTLHRNIANGRLSATRLEDGSYEIDAAELYRVFPPETLAEKQRNQAATPAGDPALAAELKSLRDQLARLDTLHEREVIMLRDRIEELRQDREDLRHERDSLLKTLQEQALSVRLLTDQRSRPPEPPPAPSSSETGR